MIVYIFEEILTQLIALFIQYKLCINNFQYNLQGSNGTKGLTQDISYQLFPSLEVIQNFPNIDAGMSSFSPNIKESLSPHEVYEKYLSPQQLTHHIIKTLPQI